MIAFVKTLWWRLTLDLDAYIKQQVELQRSFESYGQRQLMDLVTVLEGMTDGELKTITCCPFGTAQSHNAKRIVKLVQRAVNLKA